MNSILTTTKKMLGLEEEITDFDSDIIVFINSAIHTLRQIGVGPKTNFVVNSQKETYDDLLGEGSDLVSEVKTYIFYKVKLAFDPPTSSTVTEVLKESIRESEWRLGVQSDPKDFFELHDKEDKEEEPYG